jgi:triosephosphate isomerase
MMSRTKLIAGNWKMNKDAEEAKELIAGILEQIGEVNTAEVLVCPPFVDLAVVKEALRGSKVALGAQNLHWEASGAYTGEVSAAMLKAYCSHVIIGHSERRAMFGETDETVNKKVKAALAAGLIPIVCVGETLEENQTGKTAEVVARQTREGLAGLELEAAEKLVVAYEPVWAIGTGLAATPEGANEVHRDIVRPVLRELFGEEVGNRMRILYGGSMNEKNAAELLAQSDIDGGLIGGASLKPASFAAIVKAA